MFPSEIGGEKSKRNKISDPQRIVLGSILNQLFYQSTKIIATGKGKNHDE